MPTFWKTILFLTILLSACNLEKEIDIDLPGYTSQPVVECYLEPGKPYRLLLTRSAAYFATFDLDDPAAALWNGATVTIRVDGQDILLDNQVYFDPVTLQFSNYGSNEIVPEGPDRTFQLYIELENGLIISGETRILPVVPMDSLVVETNAQNKARVITYFTEDQSTHNYYRRTVNFGSRDSVLQDFLVDDGFFDTPKGAFGTGFSFEPGDTLIHTLVHMDEPYFNYLNTLLQSISANLNPFGQPGLIISTVSGTANPIGVFTGLSMDRDTLILP
ncbi:MAG: DUF4249 domain-containing protein [Saprospiraceae bacterium]|nr:DUF4249 domain-containing protein [Saprospiraceae bacterium]